MNKKTVWKFLFCLAVSLVLLTVFSACGPAGWEDDYYYDDDWVTVSYYLHDENDGMNEFYVDPTSSSSSFDPPYREGYSFNGLFTTAEGGSMMYDANGNSVAMVDSSIVLHAQWTPLAYEIVFDAGQGTLTTAETSRNVLSGTKLVEFPGATREGYVFVGWKNVHGEKVTEGVTFCSGCSEFNLSAYPVDSNGIVTLTAAYEIKEVTVTFDYGNERIETQTLPWGSPVNQIVFPFEDNGSSEIVSWSLSSGVQINYADETVRNDVTFYAIWRDYKMLTFHPGNGMEDITERVYAGVSFTAPTPTRNGYSFSGWYSSDVLAGFPEQSISYYTYYTDFYAKWTLDTYTVNFEPYGGTGDLNPLTYDFEHTLALPALEKESCTFLGWCKNEDLSDTPLKELPVGSYGDVTLYAKYEGVKTFVNLDGGEGKLSTNSFTVEYSAWNYLPVPEYEGHIFRGWFLDGVQMTDGYGKTLDLWGYQENGLTLTAEYARSYDLTVKISDERGATVNVDAKYAEGDRVYFDLVIADGWTLKDITSNIGSIKAGDTFYMPAKNITVNVTVEPNIYKITLSAGADAYIKNDSLTVEMNSKINLPTPAMQGHRFIGWFYGNEQVTDGAGALLSECGWSIASDVTLNAKYEYDGNTCEFIQSANDLLKLRDNPGGKFRLLCDITLDYWETFDFYGTFDGGGYTISGLNCGLFATLTGTVENLTLEVNADFSEWGGQRLGALAYILSDGGVVRNVTVKGTVTYAGSADVGGIIGYVSGSNTVITGCKNYANVSAKGDWSVGGIVGAMSMCPSTFNNNENYGDISNTNGNAGGIVGWTNSDAIFTDCINNAANISGVSAGGIIGMLNNGTVAINNCSSKSSISGTNIGKYVGVCYGAVTYSGLSSVTVSNAKEFVEAIKQNVASEDIILAADIDLSGISWVPAVLNGNLIGNGHTLKNLTVTSSENHVGMFTFVKGSVKDIVLSNFNITSAGHSGCARVGALCGEFNGGSISGVTLLSGAVSAGLADCGGIIGCLSAGSVSDCVNRANVSAVSDNYSGCIGGIVGYMTGGTLTECENYGTVQGAFRTGGICGTIHIGGENYSKNHMNYGDVIGKNQVAGIYGTNNAGTLTLDGCISNGKIIGDTNVGRYVGYGSAKYANLPVTTISTAEELMAIKYHVAEDSFVLQNDISLNGCTWVTSPLYASLDGNGHKITGLTAPLFGVVNGNISNLEVHYEISMAPPLAQVGGVACALKGSATITNVVTRGSITIKGNCDLGGIVGFSLDQTVITGCKNYATVTVTDNSGYSVGGICGAASYATLSNENENYGAVTNATGNVGGIFGYIERGPANQIGSNNFGSVSGKYAGGILGCQNSGTVTIDNCIVDASVKGTSNTGKYVSRGSVSYQNIPAISIKNVDQLKNLSAHVAQETYVLEADIDLSDVEWTAFDFSATLDGNGHKIIGLTTNLFNKVTGTVKNLILDAVNIDKQGQSCVAALACEIRDNAVIENVTAYGNIKAINSDHMGGIICCAYGNSIIRNCTSYLNIEATIKNADNHIGGVLSAICGGNAVTVENCINYGNVTGNFNVGGIMGWYNGSVPVKGCINYGTITSSHRAGGIIGYARKAVVIDGCGSYGEFGEGSVFGKYVCTGTATYQNLPVEKISTFEDLLELKYNIKEESYVLDADIDMTGKTWIPIVLNAKLDGNGHKIIGLTLSSSSGNLSMFTNVSGTVENLVLENVNVTSTSYDQVMVAALCDELTGGTLKNITVSGKVTAQSGRVAGIVAKVTSGTVENCKNYANIKSKMTDKDGSAAGVIAWFAGGTVKDCQNFGKIEKQHYAGGVIGFVSAFDAMGLTNYGEVVGEFDIGGVVGYAYYTSGATMNPNFINEGKVTGKENVGGVIGQFTMVGYNSQSMALNLLTNKGAVSGEKNVGGIFGYFDSYCNHYSDSIMTSTVSQLENTGNVTGKSYVGGIVGYGTTDTGNSKFIGVKSSAIIKGEYYVGGLAGKLSYIVLEDCSNEGSTVSATGYLVENSNYYTYLGGYVGYGYGITNCINNVAITHTQKGSYVGGIGGYLTGNILSSQNNADVTASKCSYVGGVAGANSIGATSVYNVKNYGNVVGADYTGGIAGKLNGESYNSSTLTLNEFENHASVTGAQYTGGIFGYINIYATHYSDSVLTINSTGFVNTGNVKGTTYVGGIMGYGVSDTGNSVMSDSSSSCTVEGEYYVGGLAGYLDYIQLSSCSNKGSSVKATGYFVDNSVYKTYLGGYAGRSYMMSDCTNEADISYSQKGGYIGGLAGYSYGAFNRCTNTGDVYAPKCENVGGIAGFAGVGAATLENNKNSGSITGNNNVGGLIGKMIGEEYNSSTLSMHGFINSGKIIGTQYTGGVIGYIDSHATHYSDSVLKMLVTGFNNTGDVTGTTYVGGIFGYGYSDTSASSISDSSSGAKIKGEYYVGGLAGCLENIQMQSCSNAGSAVTANGSIFENSEYLTYLGGYVGRGYSVNDCTNAANISYDKTGSYIGGIAGYLTSTFSSCDNSGRILAVHSDYVGGIVGYANISSGSCKIELNNNSGSVNGHDRVGGIAGEIRVTNQNAGTLDIKKQTNSNSISGVKYVGGLVGYIYADSSRSSLTVVASDFTNKAVIMGNENVGGLAGYILTDSTSSSLTGYSASGTIVCNGQNHSITFAEVKNFKINE